MNDDMLHGLKKIAETIERKSRVGEAVKRGIETGLMSAGVASLIAAALGKYRGMKTMGFGLRETLKRSPSDAAYIITKSPFIGGKKAVIDSAILSGAFGAGIGGVSGLINP
jgi:hypothetical protein